MCVPQNFYLYKVVGENIQRWISWSKFRSVVSFHDFNDEKIMTEKRKTRRESFNDGKPPFSAKYFKWVWRTFGSLPIFFNVNSWTFLLDWETKINTKISLLRPIAWTFLKSWDEKKFAKLIWNLLFFQTEKLID